MTTAPEADWRLAVVLLVLVVVAASISRLSDLAVEREHVTAAVRAVVQLAVVAVVIAAVMQSLWWSLAFVLVMFVVATATTYRRIDALPRQFPWVALTIAAGAGPVIALCVGSG